MHTLDISIFFDDISPSPSESNKSKISFINLKYFSCIILQLSLEAIAYPIN